MEIVRYYQRKKNGPTLQAALSAIGQRVGAQLVERFSREKPLLSEPLDVMKFICRDLWPEVFQKSVDNLRTNHLGTFVLRDVQFRWLIHLYQSQLSEMPGESAAFIARADLASDYLHLPCAIIRGALGALGLTASVTSDAGQLPQCDFTVTMS